MELPRTLRPATCSVTDVDAEMNRGAILLDVREPDEWDAGHAPGAVHIPLSALETQFETLDVALSYLVICKSGSRSSRACAFLSDRGMRTTNVRGGMLEWEEAGYPVVRDDGTHGAVK